MSFQICEITSAVSEMEEARYKDQPGFVESLRGSACQQIAELLHRDAAHFERRVPKKGEAGYGQNIYYRWWIGVETDKSDIEARVADMATARAKALSEAATMLRQAAHDYEHRNGPCAGVLAAELYAQARLLEKVSG